MARLPGGELVVASHDANRSPQPGEWADAYEMGRRHGYETATDEVLSIARERARAGEDITALLALYDELRRREYRALGMEGGTSGA